jgi:hypothetical protein
LVFIKIPLPTDPHVYGSKAEFYGFTSGRIIVFRVYGGMMTDEFLVARPRIGRGKDHALTCDLGNAARKVSEAFTYSVVTIG